MMLEADLKQIEKKLDQADQMECGPLALKYIPRLIAEVRRLQGEQEIHDPIADGI